MLFLSAETMSAVVPSDMPVNVVVPSDSMPVDVVVPSDVQVNDTGGKIYLYWNCVCAANESRLQLSIVGGHLNHCLLLGVIKGGYM